MLQASFSSNRRRFLQSTASLTAYSALASAAGTGLALAAEGIKLGKDTVLLVVDIQNCFLPGGTLPVTGGD